ncbi:MAG: LamG-like jellyroll fold domain-containing protein [Saprospiraceae bacterium]
MKKNLLFTLVLLFMTYYSHAQGGESAISMSGLSASVSVPDNSNGSLDVNNAHTIEMWFKVTNAQYDQKLFSKITGDLENGYILGIENSTVKYEIFDENGTKTEVVAGNVQAGQWTHVAATFTNGDKMKVYLNGVLVGETDSGTPTISYNTGGLSIGTNSWGTGNLYFEGEIDEVRFWHSALTEETISDWMVRRPTNDHPAIGSLQLYHNYNENTGQSVTDNSSQSNTGTFTSATWTASTIPFKNNQYFAVFGPVLNGVWLGKETSDASDLVTMNGVGLTAGQSAIIESNTQTNVGSFCGINSPSGIDNNACLVWHITQQGSPQLSFTLDLSDYDLSNYESAVLLQSSNVQDFTTATVIQGTLTGSTLEIPAFTLSSDNFFSLGFISPTVSTDNLDNTLDFAVMPNPSNGAFQVNISGATASDFQLSILDYSGKLVLDQQLRNINTDYQESFDLSDLPAGLYMVQLRSEAGITTRKLILK